MNDIGILKRIDHLGRIVIPKDIRDRYDLNGEVEIVMSKDGVLIKPPVDSAFTKKEKS